MPIEEKAIEKRQINIWQVAGLLFVIAICFLCIPTCDDHFFRIWEFENWKDMFLLHPNNWGDYTFAVPNNGRYLGNILGLVLGKSYNWKMGWLFRVCIMGGGLIALYALLKHLFHEIKGIAGLLVCLLVLTPINLYTEVVHWTAGYANYFLSGLGMLLLFYFLQSEEHSKVKWILAGITIALFQLFVEHVTVYVVGVATLSVCSERIKDRRWSPYKLCIMMGAIVGALVMFSNEGYRMVNTDSYRQIGLEGISLRIQMLAYDAVIGNGILLTVLGVAFACLAGSRPEKRICVSLGLYVPVMMYSLKRTFEVSIAQSSYRRLDIFAAIFAIGLIFYLICKLGKLHRREMFFYLASFCALNGMFLILTPFSARCTFAGYLMLLCLVLTVWKETGQVGKVLTRMRRVVLPLAASCFCGYLLWGYVKNYQIQYEWEEYCQIRYENEVKAMFVPELPYPHMVYSSNSLIYYIFSIYYEEPGDIYWEMWEYDRWIRELEASQ